jgi:hypothetical protein
MGLGVHTDADTALKVGPLTRTAAEQRSDVRVQGVRSQIFIPRGAVVQNIDEVVQGRRRARWTSVDML